MSGLEPLVALGLVCNIVQLVEVGLKTATLCKNAYRTGEPDPELSVYAENLAVTASSLSQSLENSQQPLNLDDSRLLALARNCCDAEAEWRKKTPARLLSQQQPRKRDRLGAIFRGIINKPEIDRLESQLQKAKDSLETILLVGIFKSLDVSKVQANDLHDKFRDLLQATSTSEKKLHDLIQTQVALVNTQISDRIDQAEVSTKTHVTTELASHESRLKSHTEHGKDTILTEAEARENSRRDNEAYERLLQSFYYPDMNSRRTEVQVSHGSTFRWLFEGELKDNHPNSPLFNASHPNSEELVCSSFFRWLKSTEDRYWISGRPGTGKSVLMKFIVSHKQTMDLLRQWQPQVQILTHFFWKVGSPMQSSFKGFLCSLVYQLFSSDRERSLGCLQQNPDWSRKTNPGDWDKEDLKSVLQSHTRPPARPFCLFIDGLDELMDGDGVGILIDFLDSLRKSSKLLKICMSSRPEHAIRMRLSDEPDLKMESLTLNDIRSYSKAILHKEIALASSPIDVEAVVSAISDKAEGVFLWAVLVTRSIARGISNGDSEDDIHKRLSKTPKKLYGLYLDMWTRLGEDSDLYQSSTALIFKSLLFTWESHQKASSGFLLRTLRYESSILELMLVSNEDLWSTTVNHFDMLSAVDLEHRCHELFTRLPVRTADLFEIREYHGPSEMVSASNSHYRVLRYDSLKVEPIHRTVFDFLIETEDGEKLMEHHKASQVELFVRKFRSCLLRDYICPKVDFYGTGVEENFNEDDHSWLFAGRRLTMQLQRLSLHAGIIHDSVLVEMLDLVWASFVQTTKNFPPQSHKIANESVPKCRLDYLLRIAPLGFDIYLRDDIIEWENARQFELLQKTITACLLSGERQCTDFELAGRQRLIERILLIFLSANKCFMSLPKGLYLSNYTLVKASIAYFLISLINTVHVSESNNPNSYSWDAHRTNAILKMIRDFRRSLCFGDHLLLILYLRNYWVNTPDFISCKRHQRRDTAVYVEISMSILIQIFLEQLAQNCAAFNRRGFEEDLDLKAFPQTVRPVKLGVDEYFLDISSTDLPIFQRYCHRKLLPEPFSTSIEDSEDAEWCEKRLAEARHDIIERKRRRGKWDKTAKGIEEGIGPNGMNYFLCSSCETRETSSA
ncbi:uncharacterized protein FMAN_03579 [Fusarium mangiferae]|uniref:Nephrocystin 3-like N-terminal domain-containing protein n=1 Tax=Fusarium mangiferae TaxID=192010 RepID=A0A1L7TGW1_FUSMA|nr:uncharacterized protein FMAN_03579 [Fusarium mangiferae]CVK94501.1 uncharacterized protein FMAN_03579 [Fusarium mangiferae]